MTEFTPPPTDGSEEFGIKLQELSKNNYAEGSIGYIYFPEILEQRMRPFGLEKFPAGYREKTAGYLADHGIYSLNDLFNLPQETFDGFPARVKSSISHNLETRIIPAAIDKLSYTPYTALLRSLIPQDGGGPLTPEDENRIVPALENLIQSATNDRESYILRPRFGLDTWQPKTLDDLASDLLLSRERIRQIEQKSLSKMRAVAHRDKAVLDFLDSFDAYPIASLGRWLGNVYLKDVGPIPDRMSNLGLDNLAETEIRQSSPYLSYRNQYGTDADPPIDQLLSLRLNKGISKEAFSMFREKYTRFLRDVGIRYRFEYQDIESMPLSEFARTADATLRYSKTTFGEVLDRRVGGQIAQVRLAKIAMKTSAYLNDILAQL